MDNDRKEARLKMDEENIKLPEELIKQVDEMAAKRTLGYKSRQEIINEAVRLKLIDLGSG